MITQAQQNIIRKRCLDDLWFLTTEVLYAHDRHKYGPMHEWMCRTCAKQAPFRELWLLPRDHFKSTIFTIAHLVQQILRNPKGSFLLCSGKEEHVLEMSNEVRKHFVFNERLQVLFSPWCAPTVDAMGSIGTWESPAKRFFGGRRKEPTVTAVSFKGRKESKHYNGGYLDDCMTSDDISETGLQEVKENYKEVIPLIDADGFVMMVGTRKHYSDLYQSLMNTGTYKVYVRHGMEHVSADCAADECKSAQAHKAADLKAGVPLEPRRMDKAAYSSKLAECEVDPKQGQSYFWHEYMNIPFAPSDRKFQPAWFVRIDDGMIPGSKPPFFPLTKWIAVDTALKDEEHPSGYDYNVVVVGGFDDQGRLYILDIFRDRNWTEKHLGDCVITCMKTSEYGGISRVITEKVGEVRFNNYLRDRARQAGVPLQIISLTRGGQGAKKKHERIVGVQGYFEQGRVFFRKSCENFEDTVNEFCNLWRWTNDDIADAISMFFDEQVKVMAPMVDTGKPQGPVLRPMPFDGPQRRAAFSQFSVKAPDALSFGRGGEVKVDGAGNILFTPEQVALFSQRPDKQPNPQPMTSFRPLR